MLPLGSRPFLFEPTAFFLVLSVMGSISVCVTPFELATVFDPVGTSSIGQARDCNSNMMKALRAEMCGAWWWVAAGCWSSYATMQA
jgi:hypothetical protein